MGREVRRTRERIEEKELRMNARRNTIGSDLVYSWVPSHGMFVTREVSWFSPAPGLVLPGTSWIVRE